MRAFTAAVIFCLVASVAPSAAVPTMKSEHTTQKPGVTRATSEVNKAFGYNFVKAIVSAVLGTGVLTAATIYANPPKSSRHEFLKRFDEQISQELAARTLKRELPTIPIDNLD